MHQLVVPYLPDPSKPKRRQRLTDFQVPTNMHFSIEQIKEHHRFQTFVTKASVDYREGTVKGDVIVVVHPAPIVYDTGVDTLAQNASLYYHYQRNSESGLFRIVDQPKNDSTE